jgi:hypothetical protein
MRRVYFTTCFGRMGPSSGYLHTLFLHQPHSVFATPPTLANIYINGGDGVVCPLLFGFINDELLK